MELVITGKKIFPFKKMGKVMFGFSFYKKKVTHDIYGKR